MQNILSRLSIKASIQNKIILIMVGFLLVYGCLLISYSTRILTAIDQYNQQIKINTDKKNNLVAIKDNILSQMNVTLLYMYTGDSSNLVLLERYISELQAQHKSIDANNSAEEVKQLDRFLSKNEDLSFTLHDQVIPVFQYGHKAEAFQMLNKKVRPGALEIVKEAKLYTDKLSSTIDFVNKQTLLIRQQEMKYLFFMLITAVLSIIGIAFYLSRYITKPIASLLEAVRKMANGDLRAKVQLNRYRDEFTELGATFNLMTSSIEQLINEKDHINQRLKIESVRAKESNRIQSQFLANMSHELRTPLTVILGFSELLLEMVDSDKAKDNLKRILNSSDHLLALINNLLDLAKIESGKMELDKKLFKIQDLIEECLKDFTEAAGKRNISVQIRSTHENITIAADRTKIKQVLLNLISNAVKFSEDNAKILISATEIEGEVRLSFKDEGIGIPENMHQKIFDRFYQVDGTLERKYGGTGLGLPLTKELVLLHGGNITVKSEPGKGSEFTVILPETEDTLLTANSNLYMHPVSGPSAIQLKGEVSCSHHKYYWSMIMRIM